MALRKGGKILLFAFAGAVGLLLVLLLAVKIALDRAPYYQTQIKEWINVTTGYQIAFARVSPAFRWYGPELYFERLELRSKDGRRLLARAAGARVAADLLRLLGSGTLLTGRLEVEAPEITVVHTGAGRFALAAEIELSGGDAARAPVTLEDLPSGSLLIHRGRFVLQDWNAAMPRLEFTAVEVAIHRDENGALVSAAARLPAVLAGDFQATLTVRGRGALSTLDWSARARVRQLALAGWHALLPDHLRRLGGGTGDVTLLASGSGADLAHAGLDCTANGVVAQLADEPAVRFERISGAFALDHAGDTWTLQGRRLRALRSGKRDPDSEFDARWRESGAQLLELKAQATYLRAETLLPLAGLLPQRDMRERLQEVAPTGEWFDTHVEFVRDDAFGPWRFSVGARFRAMGFAASGRNPGFRGLSGSVAGTERGGRIDLDTDKAVLAWPLQFAQTIDLRRLAATLYWNRSAETLLVATPLLEVQTADAALHARVAWRRPADGDSPTLTLAAGIDDGNVAQARRYVPRALLNPRTVAWLDRAFVGGHLSHADVVLDGPLRHFPFRDGTGRFFAHAVVDGATLDYHEGWPAAQHLAMVADFHNEGMDVRLLHADIGGLSFPEGNARIADFKTAELQIHLAANGDAADALAYLRASPIDDWSGRAFSAIEARGPMHAAVDLFMPFKAFDERRIRIKTQLRGIAIGRSGSPLAATEIVGDADLDGAHVVRADLHGRFLGGPFQMSARAPRGAPPVRSSLSFNGTLSGEALHGALSLPEAATLGGSADWHAVLRLSSDPGRERLLHINTTLSGLELGLPEPLAKGAGRPWPSVVDVVWPTGGTLQLHASLGAMLRGQATFPSGAHGLSLGRAAVTFGSSPTEPPLSETQIVNTGGRIERLDLGGWLRLLGRDRSTEPTVKYVKSARFDLGEVDYLGLAFTDVALDITAVEAGWHIETRGPSVAGVIDLPGAAAEPWRLDFTRLKFADQSAVPNGASRDAAAGSDPRRIPALRFHAADMVWGERQFGEVSATLSRLEDGIALQKLNVTGESFSVDAIGEWRGQDAGSGRIEGALTSSDVAATLRRLGYAPVIESKSGKLDFDLSWKGAPAAGSLGLAVGRVQVALDKGQITGLKPGAGRVVGLASIAALPRRLALDFSDLTDRGFAFDTVRGNFDLRDGSAYTDDLLVRGPAAEIGLIGRVGLKARDYDQTAVVTGNLSDSLPLAAFVGGPVIGAAVLVFTQVFKQPLKGLARGYYRITGSWEHPTVERIKSAAATAAAEAPK